MPPHRVAAVLRTLAPNSIPRLSPPRATHPPNFLPGPLSRSSPPPPPPRVLTLRARRVSRRNFPGARRDTPIHHYRSIIGTTTIIATTTNVAVATTTIQSRSRSPSALPRLPVATRRCVAYGASPPNFPLLSRFNPYSTPAPFPSFHSDSPLRPRSACHPFLRIYPARFLLRFSFKFHPTFSTQPHRSSRRRCYRDIRYIYISRARGSFYPPAIPSLYLFLSLARFLP